MKEVNFAKIMVPDINAIAVVAVAVALAIINR